MTDALALGEKLLALLEESARTTTYKPALLLALIDRAQEYSGQEWIPVRALAERVIELYWPQTLAYPTTGHVLKQSQTSSGRAAIVQAILAFRDEHAASGARAAARDPTRARMGATRCASRGNARRVADPTIAAPIRAVPLQLRLGLGGGRRLVGARISHHRASDQAVSRRRRRADRARTAAAAVHHPLVD